MKIKDLPIESQPRERLLRFGVSSLSDAELLAIILQKGTRDENIIDMSNRLLKENLSDLSLEEMKKIKGIGDAKAMQIIALYEFSRRNAAKKDSKVMIRNANDIYNIMKYLKEEKKEHLFGIYLDSKNQIIGKPELISLGILDASLVHPREILKEAIRKSAKSFILIHNHPSNSTEPSSEDIEITQRMKESGELLDIKLLDHVIIGEGYFSFRERGMLD